ncbi:MAG: restriction endonuclease [Solirubrobacteraceae bacterium]
MDAREAVRSPGRTTTTLDDRLIRALAPLDPAIVLGIACAAYAAWGVAVPLLIGAQTAWLLIMNTTGVVLAGAIVLARLFPVVEARLRRRQFELTADLRHLSAHEFELLVGELFRREGWEVRETGREGQPDGNVDLRVQRGTDERLVQCKHWQAWSVGVDEVRKLAGTLLREGLQGSSGLLVTSSTFTPAAIAEAKHLRMDLLDGRDLLARLDQAGASSLVHQARIVDRAWVCPECSTPMLLAQSFHGWWLRCPQYPSGCRGKHDLGRDPRRALEALLNEPGAFRSTPVESRTGAPM